MEERLLIAINGLRAPALDALLGPLSEHGIYAFPLLMLLALTKGWRAQARAVADGWLAWFVGLYLTELIVKPLIARPRPTAHDHLRELLDVLGRVPSPSSLSFPSGTASAAFAGSTWIWLRFGWRAGAPATALAALVGLSRVYAGVHWPTDIVGGALIGAAVAYGWHRLSRVIDDRPAAAG